MKYKDFKMLSKDDMKQIIGGLGGGAGSCTANCVNANSISIDCGTGGDCTARDNIGVFCSGGDKKCCYEGVPCFKD